MCGLFHKENGSVLINTLANADLFLQFFQRQIHKENDNVTISLNCNSKLPSETGMLKIITKLSFVLPQLTELTSEIATLRWQVPQQSA